MKIITNEQIASLITMEDAIATMREAFFQFNQGGEMQSRVRIGKNEIKLSMMGAILPGINVSGAKIYTTLNGRFTFIVVLFSNSDGKILAVITRDDSASGFAVSKGNLVDLAPLPTGEDHLNELFLYLDDEFPRQARYERVDRP